MSCKKCEIKDDNAVYRTGFMADYLEINREENSVEFVDCLYQELEEGFTEYDTQRIVKIICLGDADLKRVDLTTRYEEYVSYVSTIMDYSAIRRVVNECRIESDDFMYKINNLENGDILRSILMGFKNKLYEEKQRSDNANENLSVSGIISLKLLDNYCKPVRERLNKLTV